MKDEKEVRKEFFLELTRCAWAIAVGSFCVWLVVYGVIVASSILFPIMTSPLCVGTQAKEPPEKIVHKNESNWEKAKRETKEATSSIGEATKETAGKGWDKTKGTSKKAWNSTKTTSKKTWKVMKKSLSDTGGSIKKGFGDAVDAIEGK
jgi:hypothetical protein